MDQITWILDPSDLGACRPPSWTFVLWAYFDPRNELRGYILASLRDLWKRRREDYMNFGPFGSWCRCPSGT